MHLSWLGCSTANLPGLRMPRSWCSDTRSVDAWRSIWRLLARTSCEALVLTGAPVARPAGPSRRPPAAFRLVRSMRRAHLVPETTLERARNRYGSPDYLAARGVMRQVLVRLLAERYDEQLSALRCGVELVWGDDDVEVPLSVAEAVASAVPGAVLTVCPGAGHLTPLSVPDSLRDAVDRALEAPHGASAR